MSRIISRIMNKISVIIICIVLCNKFCTSLHTNISHFGSESNDDFDLLIFTQSWPITNCIQWMNEGSDHACILPSQKDNWIIHGIWPTQMGTIGPSFCNKSAIFDVNTLKPIMEQLERNWANIEKGKSEISFWRHEWLKHGTCASVISDLRTENKYFGQGLLWLQQFEMTSLLSKANITPGANYNATNIYMAIKNELKRDPFLHCIKEKHSQIVYLAEIRICFNKQLELMDCDGIKSNQKTSFGNCRIDELVAYPSAMPGYPLNRPNSNKVKSVWTFPWVNLYKLIQIVKWFTL